MCVFVHCQLHVDVFMTVNHPENARAARLTKMGMSTAFLMFYELLSTRSKNVPTATEFQQVFGCYGMCVYVLFVA